MFSGDQDLAGHVPAALAEVLRALPRMAVAFSGGLDSRFLCHAALLCGCEVLAVHAVGPHIPPQESEDAVVWAQARGLPLLTVDYDPLVLPEVMSNSPMRCYGCKKGLIAVLRNVLAEQGGESFGRTLCDGTNADDLQAYRPGLKALAEGCVRSPLAEAGLKKSAVREASRICGLDRPEQRARPCLLTRLAYGLEPDAATLRRLAQAEAALAAMRPSGAVGDEVGNASVSPLGDFRLRLTPAPVLQAERLPQPLRKEAERLLAVWGFWPCAFQIGGKISGFYDGNPSG